MDDLVRRICIDFGVKLLTDGKDVNVDTFVDAYFLHKQTCTSVTAKGARCSKIAVNGTQTCSVHSKLKNPSEKKRAKKSDKLLLAHAHGLTSPCVNCDLCALHGDAFKLPEYEVV